MAHMASNIHTFKDFDDKKILQTHNSMLLSDMKNVLEKLQKINNNFNDLATNNHHLQEKFKKGLKENNAELQDLNLNAKSISEYRQKIVKIMAIASASIFSLGCMVYYFK